MQNVRQENIKKNCAEKLTVKLQTQNENPGKMKEIMGQM